MDITSRTAPNRRKTKRTQVDGRAAIHPADHSEVFHCDLIDLTNNGARVDIGRMSEQLHAPFDFSFDGFKTIRPSRLIWCHGSIAGIEFIASE
jgi:PilZ domain-containing protein